jgi:large subunit ribosomal protein L17
MRKLIFGKKLSRNRKSRKALFRSLIRALVISGKIKTTSTKAKAIEKDLYKLIRLAKAESLSSRRKALEILGNDNLSVDKIFKEKFVYIKKTNLLPRKGDNAPWWWN